MSLAAADLPLSLARHIATQIGDEIEQGLWKPGERLSEEVIARRFGVSRGPVREALQILAREELAVIRPRLGASVIQLQPDEIIDMFEVRGSLYALAIRLFVRRATAAEMDGYIALGQEIRRIAAGEPDVDPREFARAIQAASAYALAHSGNARLKATMGRMNRQAYRYYAILMHSIPAHRRALLEMSARMNDAIHTRDAETASIEAWRIVELNQSVIRRILGIPGTQPEETPCSPAGPHLPD
ncbi:MAG: GntR family transcriptional regulator [Alphaproteobacteria bacterium]|jgi:DNA-binding GntR family transcriptional regulator|nr:GntR family transcriptional regulator [Alphaproteobacteria bacterium]